MIYFFGGKFKYKDKAKGIMGFRRGGGREVGDLEVIKF